MGQLQQLTLMDSYRTQQNQNLIILQQKVCIGIPFKFLQKSIGKYYNTVYNIICV